MAIWLITVPAPEAVPLTVVDPADPALVETIRLTLFATAFVPIALTVCALAASIPVAVLNPIASITKSVARDAGEQVQDVRPDVLTSVAVALVAEQELNSKATISNP